MGLAIRWVGSFIYLCAAAAFVGAAVSHGQFGEAAIATALGALWLRPTDAR